MAWKPKAFFLIFFGVLSLIHLIARISGELPLVDYLTKPLLIPLLAAYFWSLTKDRGGGHFRVLLTMGLVFSAIGDTLLLFSGSDFFLLGLGSFLLAHLCYLSGFLSLESLREGWLRHHLGAAMPFLVYLAGLLVILWAGLPAGMRGPVLVYGIVITLMALTCLNLKERLSGGAFRLLFSGVLLFVISDSILAIDRFRGEAIPIPVAGFLIMATYLTAQLLITLGCVSAFSGYSFRSYPGSDSATRK